MKIYLMQHGEAMSEQEHPDRPLTARGQNDVERVAAFLARAGIPVAHIWHSGKRRATETANLVAQQLQTQAAAVSGLNPNDAVPPMVTALEREPGAIMLVGHLPFLSRLASALLVGDPEKMLARFQMGGVLCLERQEGKWIIAWMVTPELL